MSKVERIVFFGLKGAGKTLFWQKIVKKYAFDESHFTKINPLINHAESLIKLNEHFYLLTDTPAFISHPLTEIEKAIQKQNQELITDSCLICWVIDANQEMRWNQISQEIEKLNKYLKKFPVPKILILNKLNLANKEEENVLSFFKRLGQKHFFPFSAHSSADLEKLVDKIISFLPQPKNNHKSPNIIKETKKTKLAIFGPPNSGKSTLLNNLLKKNRSLVSPIAGTTQEPVRDYWSLNNNYYGNDLKKWEFEITDTAGISKVSGKNKPEEQNYKETQKVLRSCNLAWVIIDATLPLTKQICQIVHWGEKYQKPLTIIINKCDLIEDNKKKEFHQKIREKLKSLNYAPITFLSALKGIGIIPLMKILAKMIEQSQRNFPKRNLQNIIEKMSAKNPYSYKGNRLKIYFSKHESGLVHCFVFFVNNPSLAHFSYQRYMTNYLRKELKLEYLPIRLFFKKST